MPVTGVLVLLPFCICRQCSAFTSQSPFGWVLTVLQAWQLLGACLDLSLFGLPFRVVCQGSNRVAELSRWFFPVAEAKIVKKDLFPVAEFEIWNRTVPEDVLGSGCVVVFQRSVAVRAVALLGLLRFLGHKRGSVIWDTNSPLDACLQREPVLRGVTRRENKPQVLW